MRNRTLTGILALALVLLLLPAPVRAGGPCTPLNFFATGANAAAIQATIDSFRNTVGVVNNGVGGTFPSGRREINWDNLPDYEAAPGYLYSAYLNDISPRGLVMLRGDRPWVQSVISADSDNPAGTPVRFGNFNLDYTTAFATFTAERLFGLRGTNVVDLIFYEVGNTNRGLVSAVGAVFVDVDVAGSSRIQLYDINGALLANTPAQAAAGNANLSFLGVYITPPCQAARARLTIGSAPLGADDLTQGGTDDIVAIDDLIWGEPQGVVFFDGFDLLQDTSLWQ